MTPATRKALEGSIRKWERIVIGTGKDLGHRNCALCKMFFDADDDETSCKGCPVMTKTGHSHCNGTAYRTYTAERSAHGEDSIEARKQAFKELRFLESLRP